MKKSLAAVALAGALALTGCASNASTAPQQPASTAQAASTPSVAPSTQTPSQTPAQGATSAASGSFQDTLEKGLRDKITASAGDTAKYLPTVRASVKTGSDADLWRYGAEVCAASSSTDGVNAVVAEMTSAGLTKVESAAVLIDAGYFLCPAKKG